jgi:tRNA wybutosine-synthesizing protein 2
LSDCADRVNLGLIPSSEDSWPIACVLLRKKIGGFLHIHGNVDIKNLDAKNLNLKQDWIKWSEDAKERIQQLLTRLNKLENEMKWIVNIKHIEYVKSYASRVDHLVLDLHCFPVRDTEQKEH